MKGTEQLGSGPSRFLILFYLIRDSCVQEKGGTKRIKLNISQNVFGLLLRVILTSEGT